MEKEGEIFRKNMDKESQVKSERAVAGRKTEAQYCMDATDTSIFGLYWRKVEKLDFAVVRGGFAAGSGRGWNILVMLCFES